MPIGYVVTMALLAWCTAGAVAPKQRDHSSPSNLSFRFGFVLNELPLVAFCWLLAATSLAAVQGGLDSPLGRVGVGLAVVTTAGLIIVAGRGWRTKTVVERAMAVGLGARWRVAIETGLAARLRRRPWARIVVWPFPLLRRDVKRVADIRYGDAGRDNLLDVYRARSRPASGPTLVYLHGGAFRSGRKNREARPLIYRLASQGWICVSANYRLSPEATFPDQLIDIKKVIAWVRQHGPAYGADPKIVFIAGSSAGGHLAAIAAMTPNDPAYQPGFEPADTSITAAVMLYAYYGSIDTDGPPSSPHDYIQSDAPPFFVAHGDRDTIVVVDDARAFVRHLRSTSTSPVVYAELPGAQHSFDLFHSIRFEPVVDAIEAFATSITSHG